jgi:hypothetical protein
MSSYRAVDIIVVGVLVIASCARADRGLSPPVQSAPREPDTAPREAGASPLEVPDRDNDGIRDDVDRCPDDPEDCDGFEDGDGCPDEDNDRDGVLDRCDRCPNFPGTTIDGCPYVRLDYDIVRVLQVASFEINDVKPTLDPELDVLVALAKEDRLQRLGIVGHALASERDAARLAIRRAEAVKKLFVGRGVSPTKLELRAAPVGDVASCPAPGDGGPPRPCVSFALVEIDSMRMTWNGSSYLFTPPPPPKVVCPPPPSRAPGHPCGQP